MAAYFGRLRACTLTGAWLRLHVCPLGTLELEGVPQPLEPTLTSIRLGLVDVAWHTILVLHLMLHHEHRPSATATVVTPKFGEQTRPRRGAAAYAVDNRGLKPTHPSLSINKRRGYTLA